MIPSYIHLLRAKDLMDRRFAEPLVVAELAATAYASPAHFARSFKRAFGETPHRYLQRRRIERAMDLIRATEAPLTQIALDVGFATPSSFTRAFHEVTGAPPSAYAARARAGAPAIPGCFALMWTRPSSSRQAEPAARV
jgi:AraC-like DNA-binding protein